MPPGCAWAFGLGWETLLLVDCKHNFNFFYDTIIIFCGSLNVVRKEKAYSFYRSS